MVGVSAISVSGPTRSDVGVGQGLPKPITTLRVARLLLGGALLDEPPRALLTMEASERYVSAHSWMADYFLGVTEEALLADRARFIDTSEGGSLAFPARRWAAAVACRTI